MSQALEGKGITTWIDEKEMKGNIDQQMCRGIEESLTVIVFVTKKYLEKVDSDGNDNCKFEFGYAKRHKTVKNMILVLMEDVPTPWSGPVGLALGDDLYYSYKTDDELEQCVEDVVAQIEERKKTQHTGPEKKKENIHACFVIPQPSSAAPSSHFKLKADLKTFEKCIKDNTKLSGLRMIICGGSCREVGRHLLMYLGPRLDPPVTRAQICFVLADGFDKSLTDGTSYLDQIIEMKPKIVVLCASRGAECIGEYLSNGGVGAIFWTRFDTNGIDRRHLFRKVWLPFCENLLERKDSDESLEALKKSLIACCRPFIIDETWHGRCGEVGNFTDLNALELDTHPGEGSVEILMSNFGDTNMVGFDPKKQAFLKYRASHLPWIEKCTEKLKKLRERQDGIRYLDVKTGLQDAFSYRDFIILLCMCTIDDETLDVSGVYYLSQESHKTRVSTDQIDGDENTIVWIDNVKELFPSPDDLITWLRQFENHCITFLFGSDKRNNNEEYVSALIDFDGDEHTIRDTSASNCNMTSHTLDHHSRYQGTIKVLPPNDDADNGDVGSRPDIVALKECIASLADSSPERIDVYDDDDRSMWIQVGVRNLKHLKELFHNLLNKSESLKESYPGARFSMESATALYKDACLKFHQLTTEQNDFIEDVWMDQDNLNMHLKGAAGTGKTFVALHCCLDYLDLKDTSETQPSVLFVCPTKALGYHFISWLLARVNNNSTIRRRLLDKINLLVSFQSEYKAFKIKMERNDSDNLKERVFEIKDYSIFGLIIVDEAQAVFRVGEGNGQLPSPLLQSLQSKNEQQRLLLLSDISQAQSVEEDIKFPFDIDEVSELEVVSRSSENIAAASLAYQLGKKSKCSHGVSGPRVRVDLFDMKNKDSVPLDLNHRDTVDAYASRVSSRIDEIKTMLEGESLHKLVAIILPEENFCNMLINSGIFEKMDLKPVTAEDAMKRKGPDSDNKIPWVVVDTPSNLTGLEFLFVILVGLDSPIVKDGDQNLNKNILSCIYRGMSRGHYAVFIINHIIEDGWFEWLKWVSTPKEDKAAPSKINAPSNFNRIRDNVDRATLEKIVHRKDDGASSQFKYDNAKTPSISARDEFSRSKNNRNKESVDRASLEQLVKMEDDPASSQFKNVNDETPSNFNLIRDDVNMDSDTLNKKDDGASSQFNNDNAKNVDRDTLEQKMEDDGVSTQLKNDNLKTPSMFSVGSKLRYDAFDNSDCHKDILNDKNADLNDISFKPTNDLDTNDEHDEAAETYQAKLEIALKTGDRNGEGTRHLGEQLSIQIMEGIYYSSSHKHIFKSLSGKIEGIPVWPPIKELKPLNIVVVRKDGTVRSLDLKAEHLQDVQDKKKLKELSDSPNFITEKREPYTVSQSNDAFGEVRAFILQSFGVSMKNSIDMAVSIDEMTVTRIATKDDKKDPLGMLVDALKGAKIRELYARHGKSIYVIYEVTNTTGFTLTSSKISGAGAGLKIVPDQSFGFKIGSEKKTDFDSDTNVTIGIKALRFNVSKEGILGEPKRVAIDHNHHGEDEDENEKPNVLPIPSKKLALLIGNNAYKHIRPLRGCGNDVDNFGKYLSDRGFEAEKLKDLDYDGMLGKMDEYVSTKNVRKGDMVVFYYAGHGSVRRRADDGDEFATYEQTICPIDSSRTGTNRDISRDIIQAWVGKMESKGVKVLLFFDSSHSCLMIRKDEEEEEIPDGCRTARHDDRPVTRQDRPRIPDYDWLKAVKNNEEIKGAFCNLAWLAACKSYEYAKEKSSGGVMTTSLISILEESEKEEHVRSTFRQIMERLQRALKKEGFTQNPDFSGNVDTVAFCIQNLMKLAPLPYYRVTALSPSQDGVMKMKFYVPPFLPLITKGSKFALYDPGDSNMKTKLATIEIGKISPDMYNIAHARIYDDDTTVGSFPPQQHQMFRAVEIQHEVGARRHYVGVSIEGSSKELQELKEILCDLKGRMFKHRNDFPVKVLPPTSLIMIGDSGNDHDVIVQLSDGNILTITNKQGHLVCPRIEVKSHCDLNLAASYIASYAHWNMMRTISNPKTKMTNKIDIVIKGRLDDYDSDFERVLTPNERGEYELDWDDFEDTSEYFKICAKISDLEEPCALMLVELDIDYGVYHHMNSYQKVGRGSSDVTLTKRAKRLPIEDIAKVEGNSKWCNPLFEWKLFIMEVPKGDEKGEYMAFSLADKMQYVESEGIQKADYSINDTVAQWYKMPTDEETIGPADWTCIPIYFCHKGLKKYARERANE